MLIKTVCRVLTFGVTHFGCNKYLAIWSSISSCCFFILGGAGLALLGLGMLRLLVRKTDHNDLPLSKKNPPPLQQGLQYYEQIKTKSKQKVIIIN